MNGQLSKPGDVKKLLFSDREWAGFTWLLKVLAVYISAGVIITLAYRYTPAERYLSPFLVIVSFPVYVPMIALLLGIPAFNLCRAAVTRFESKSKALPVILAIIALFCACVIIPQIVLPGILPVFTSALAVLLILFIFLLGCWGTLKFIVNDIRAGIKK